MERDIFFNISPLDARYYDGSPRLLDSLSKYLSEKSVVLYEAAVEAAVVRVMERHGVAPPGSGEQLRRALRTITPEEVYEEEHKTRHNIRALVNVLQRRVDGDVAPYIHLAATSEDITGTATALRTRDAFYKVIVPKALELLAVLLDIAQRESGTVQMGRTHGQHAVPITVGYLFSGYADRFGGRVLKIVDAVNELRGKMSGAVGAYNSFSLFLDDPRAFEEDVLAELRLAPAAFASQIVQPEYMLDLVHAVVSAFGVLAQIADDMRHLQRTEIGEFAERFEKGQVGSSTMPHKRNPWNFEHVKSLWKEFVPRILTRYHDQISEHQRDLTNSASGRFVVEIFAAFTLATERLAKQLEKLVVDYERIRENLSRTTGSFLAEPLYILLAAKGEQNAHELVKQATLAAEKQKKTLFRVIEGDPAFKSVLDSDAWKRLERNPAGYAGIARERALAVSNQWKSKLGGLETLCAEYRELMYE